MIFQKQQLPSCNAEIYVLYFAPCNNSFATQLQHLLSCLLRIVTLAFLCRYDSMFRIHSGLWLHQAYAYASMVARLLQGLQARPLLLLLRLCVTSLGRKSHLSKKKNVLFPPNPVVVTQSSRGLKAEEATNGKGKQRLHTILTFSMCAQLQFSAFILLI